MSSYEIGLKNEYINKGYRYIGDFVSETSEEAVRRGINVGRTTRDKIVCIQGECVAFNKNRRKGISRWLLFEKPNARR